MTGATNSSSTEPGQVRRFGLVALLFFGALAGLALWRDKPLLLAFFGVLATAGLLFIALPGPLAPAYRAWMRAAHRIGTVVTAIVLTIAYYAVMTPAAFIKRVFSGRPLPTAPDPDTDTYWVDRPGGAQPKEQFYKRY